MIYGREIDNDRLEQLLDDDSYDYPDRDEHGYSHLAYVEHAA